MIDSEPMVDFASVSLARIADYLERIAKVQEEQNEMGKAAMLQLKDGLGLEESLNWASSIILDEDEEDADS